MADEKQTPKIVAAIGTAIAAGANRGLEMQKAMDHAVTASLAQGITDPEKILAAKNAARKALKDKWHSDAVKAAAISRAAAR